MMINSTYFPPRVPEFDRIRRSQTQTNVFQYSNILRQFEGNGTQIERIVPRHGRRISKKCLLQFHQIA